LIDINENIEKDFVDSIMRETPTDAENINKPISPPNK